MKKGMTPEAVEQMSQQIGQAGEDAMQAFEQVASRVESLDWTGEDRDRYVGEFTGALREAALKVKQGCDEFSDRGLRNVAGQRKISS